MKAKAKQYAQSLFETVEKASEEETKKIVNKFADNLIKNNQISQLERILDSFNMLWNKKKNVVEAEIISAKKLDNDTVATIEKYIKKKTVGKEIVISKNIDEKIKGGFVVKLGNVIFDSSLKTRLNQLKKELYKNS